MVKIMSKGETAKKVYSRVVTTGLDEYLESFGVFNETNALPYDPIDMLDFLLKLLELLLNEFKLLRLSVFLPKVRYGIGDLSLEGVLK